MARVPVRRHVMNEHQVPWGTKMRIALILPQRRLGLWHERLAQTLSSQHSVSLFVDDVTPAYPLPLQAWLWVERSIYGGWDAPSAVFTKSLRQRAGEVAGSEFDIVIDLSERPRPGSISAFYGGSTDSLALVERLLSRKTPYLSVSQTGTGQVLAQSLPAMDDKLRLSRGLQLCFARCIALIERALRQEPVERIAGDLAPGFPPSGNLVSRIARFGGAKAAKALLNKSFPPDQWQIALRTSGGPFVPIRDDGKRCYADPFLYRFQGKTFVFLEEYPDATRKGVISAAEVAGDRLVSNPVPVLERPYHLSYPVVIEDAGAIYMIPESSANKTIELYRAVAFPWQWEFERVLVEGMAFADATPIFHQNRWWLFTTASHDGTTDCDELFIFYSDRLTGPWLAHAQNPVKSDCRSARPAGCMISEHGRLFRPTQICDEDYGVGIVWHEVTELTPSRFSEREIARFDATNSPAIVGLHTINRLGPLQAVDIKLEQSFGRREKLTPASMLRLAHDLDVAFAPVPDWRQRDADHSAAASRQSLTNCVA